MLGRLLQYLQKRVEGRRREHVDFVHDIHALFHLRGRVDRLVAQRTHVVHAVVGRRVQLHHVKEAAALDAKTARTRIAGVAVHRVLAVDRLGQDLRAGRLARASRAGKEIGVRKPPLGDLPLQRRGDVLLPYHIRKGLWPPLAVKRLIHDPTPSIKKLLRIQPRNRRPHGT